ncbi:hypothetical protein ACNS7O_03545 [Haloferacaceae archaeon DSL9]
MDTSDTPAAGAHERSTCVWCGESLSTSETVTIGPPPGYSDESFHAWTLHSWCARDWETLADQLFRLSRMGAHATLIDYPKEHGPDRLPKR